CSNHLLNDEDTMEIDIVLASCQQQVIQPSQQHPAQCTLEESQHQLSNKTQSFIRPLVYIEILHLILHLYLLGIETRNSTYKSIIFRRKISISIHAAEIKQKRRTLQRKNLQHAKRLQALSKGSLTTL